VGVIGAGSPRGNSTNPKFASLYRLGNLFPDRNHRCISGSQRGELLRRSAEGKSVYGLDGGGGYGIGIALAFEAQAKKRGIEVLGHDRLDPQAADNPAITKTKALGAQSIYCGGRCTGRDEAGEGVL